MIDPFQVVCIADDWRRSDNNLPTPLPTPIKGGVYTVLDERIVFGTWSCEGVITDRMVCYLLEGFDPTLKWIKPCFRPVRKTSIEVFKGLLVPTKKLEPV